MQNLQFEIPHNTCKERGLSRLTKAEFLMQICIRMSQRRKFIQEMMTKQKHMKEVTDRPLSKRSSEESTSEI